MSRSHTRNNVLVGLFLVTALLLGVVASFVLAGFSIGPTAAYTVRFPVETGTPGLREGAAVSVGGQPVGRVLRVSLATDDETGSPRFVDAYVRIRADMKLYPNAVADLDAPLLGTISEINFREVGDPSSGAALESGARIEGRLAPPALLAQSGFGPAQRDSVAALVDDMAAGAEAMRRLLDRIEPALDPAVSDTLATLEDLRDMTASLRGSLDGWTARMDSIMEDTSGFTSRLGPTMEQVEAVIEDGRAVAGRVRELVDENEGRVDRIIADVERAVAMLADESVPAARDAVESGRKAAMELEQAAASGRRLAEEAGAILDEQAPSIRRAMANARLTSDQLRLVATEVRQQPWRLLIRPNTRELESQVLYDAARSYAGAVSDLRAASESLESALARSPDDRERLKALGDRLAESFEAYADAERALLEKMTTGPRR